MTPPSVAAEIDAALLTFHRAMQSIPAEDDMGRGVPLAVLVDPGLHDPLSQDPHARSVPRLTLSIPGIDTARAPYLLLASSTSMNARLVDFCLRLSVEEALGLHDSTGLRPRSVCALLIPRDLREPNWVRIGHALTKSATVLPPVGSRQRVAFRYWDPRLATRLEAALGASTWGDRLRRMGVNQWWAVDESGRLWSSDALPARSGERTPERGWALDASQWQRMQALGRRNALLQAARAWGIDRCATEELIDDVVRRTFELGLEDPRDVHSFGYLALTVHDQFDRHPDVTRALQRLPDAPPPGAFAALVQSWSDEFLDDLRRGAWLSPPSGSPTPSSRSAA